MSKKKQKIKEQDLQGFKYFKKLSQMLERDLKQPVRVIQLKITEQTQYSSHTLPYRGRKQPETMLICTDRLDLPAEVIALIYKGRGLTFSEHQSRCFGAKTARRKRVWGGFW